MFSLHFLLPPLLDLDFLPYIKIEYKFPLTSKFGDPKRMISNVQIVEKLHYYVKNGDTVSTFTPYMICISFVLVIGLGLSLAEV